MGVMYPDIKPYATHQLRVDAIHTLYVEESGEPEGVPVLFLHGGPGAGCEPYHRRFFDPNRYRIILFDQRGCGLSSPHAELNNNDTGRLISDIEAIRDLLDIESWVVFGGSWGSTLALAYAEAHPSQVRGLVLRGIFLCRQREIEWFYQGGASRIFPDYWQDFISVIPSAERGDMLGAYYRRLTGKDELARMAAAKAWALWEARTATLLPAKEIVDHFSDPHVALSMARIESHYFTNNAFLAPNQLLDNIEKIADIPGIIVQGRYDCICPMESAWELHTLWPNSRLSVVDNAGHSASEYGICRALIQATDYFAEQQALE
ncbi:MAG: prolyl aminopeptidase [Gammaproteobacteria bacterium]